MLNGQITTSANTIFKGINSCLTAKSRSLVLSQERNPVEMYGLIQM
jgi:hypothetical protein|tara:strand:+ start:242 stop:379 length:138 start_codon:yes stop_codon:yes gene_type:complete